MRSSARRYVINLKPTGVWGRNLLSSLVVRHNNKVNSCHILSRGATRTDEKLEVPCSRLKLCFLDANMFWHQQACDCIHSLFYPLFVMHYLTLYFPAAFEDIKNRQSILHQQFFLFSGASLVVPSYLPLCWETWARALRLTAAQS